jgi:hypothetical protein
MGVIGLHEQLVTSRYWQDLDLSGFKNLKGLALFPALNEKLQQLLKLTGNHRRTHHK